MKESLLTNIKAGENYSTALDLALDVMRKTPHTRLERSAFELHYGRKPNTEITNMMIGYISAKPDAIQVYSFSGDGGQSDLLPMKPQRRSAKVVSNYPFYFL